MATRKFKIKIDGKSFEAEVEEIGSSQVQQTAPRQAAQKAAPAPAPTPTPAATGNTIVSPMPGKIISIKVSQGQKIKKGDVVLILEAMKMEQEIKSSLEGTVSEIAVSEGDTVKKEQQLIVVN